MEDLLSGRVLDLIQSSFPLEHDPYGVMAVQLGTTRDEVLAAVEELRRSGTVRRMGASFASKKLGYSSSLCALAVPGDAAEVDRVAGIVNAYPGVTHNYLRDNRFNLWFTIIARGKAEIARILAEIQEEAGCGEALNLPATKLYKIRVDFSEMNSKSVSSSCHLVRPLCHPEPKAKDLRTLEVFQGKSGASPFCHPERSEGSPGPRNVRG
jgi:DNA-binding Lrp family transcriptional regulator